MTRLKKNGPRLAWSICRASGGGSRNSRFVLKQAEHPFPGPGKCIGIAEALHRNNSGKDRAK
jgi:hypothetical protein